MTYTARQLVTRERSGENIVLFKKETDCDTLEEALAIVDPKGEGE
jgi:hypothetical protein